MATWSRFSWFSCYCIHACSLWRIASSSTCMNIQLIPTPSIFSLSLDFGRCHVCLLSLSLFHRSRSTQMPSGRNEARLVKTFVSIRLRSVCNSFCMACMAGLSSDSPQLSCTMRMLLWKSPLPPKDSSLSAAAWYLEGPAAISAAWPSTTPFFDGAALSAPTMPDAPSPNLIHHYWTCIILEYSNMS